MDQSAGGACLSMKKEEHACGNLHTINGGPL